MNAAKIIAAIAGLTLVTLGSAYAADSTKSCDEEIANVTKAYAAHIHQQGGKDALNWRQVEQVVAAARRSCAEGKSAQAYEQVNLANRWLSRPEHTNH